MDLAEMLYNLQGETGFDECIYKMRRGDIDGTYAELDFGRMLYLYQVPFRYVVPTGSTGDDYDVEILYPNGTTVCGDAKCKLESTVFSRNTVDHALEQARSQLPKGRPGIVFLKLPMTWLDIPNILQSCIDTAADFLRTTRRVVSVKYYTSHIAVVDEMIVVHHAGKEISNPSTDFGNNLDWDIFPPNILPHEWNGMPPWWQRIIYYPDGRPR
jgi:hypothetical protein